MRALGSLGLLFPCKMAGSGGMIYCSISLFSAGGFQSFDFWRLSRYQTRPTIHAMTKTPPHTLPAIIGVRALCPLREAASEEFSARAARIFVAMLCPSHCIALTSAVGRIKWPRFWICPQTLQRPILQGRMMATLASEMCLVHEGDDKSRWSTERSSESANCRGV